jgi:hypothetical protein
MPSTSPVDFISGPRMLFASLMLLKREHRHLDRVAGADGQSPEA